MRRSQFVHETPFPNPVKRSRLQILAHERKGQFRDKDGLDETGHASCDAGRGEESIGGGKRTEDRNTPLYTLSSPSSPSPLHHPSPPPLLQQPKPVKPSPHPLSLEPSPPTSSETHFPSAPSSPASHAGYVSVLTSFSEDLPRRSGRGSRVHARFPALSVGGDTGRSVVAIGR
ncbi:hypothetical protein KC323_g144 [Hortaea werneckii]|nr:hypothetical protein KC323_g144 [Hortaea werneckii]